MIISLLGFMGSGKSSIGRRLSKMMNIPLIDLDEYLEAKEGLSINEIFDQHGEDFFRLLESHYLMQIVKSKEDLILALGGGTPCRKANWKYIKKTHSVYLKRSEKYLFNNLKEKKSKRPIIKNLNNTELKLLVKNKLADRSKFYEKAKMIIDIDLSKKQIAKIIRDSVKKNG